MQMVPQRRVFLQVLSSHRTVVEMKYFIAFFITSLCLICVTVVYVVYKNEKSIHEYRDKHTSVSSSSGGTLPFLIKNICLDGYSVYVTERAIMYRKELIENTITLVRCGDK